MEVRTGHKALRCEREDRTSEARVRQALQRWPENGWLANSVAYASMQSSRWAEAVPDLERAMRLLPMRRESLAVDIARLKRYQDPNVDLTALASTSPNLKAMLEWERSKGGPQEPGAAYALLARGALFAAVDSVKDDPQSARHVLLLAAASDTASENMVARALALPAQADETDNGNLLMLALATREGRDTAAMREQAMRSTGRYGKQLMAFLDSVKKGADPRQSERLLDGVEPPVRALAYSAGLVLAGQRAPAEWRKVVRSVLFAHERPYFT